MGWSTPLTASGSAALTRTGRAPEHKVSWVIRKPPAEAVCSMRAAMLTGWPRMLESSSTSPPSSTPPAWMPTRIHAGVVVGSLYFGAEGLTEFEQGQAAAPGRRPSRR